MHYVYNIEYVNGKEEQIWCENSTIHGNVLILYEAVDESHNIPVTMNIPLVNVLKYKVR